MESFEQVYSSYFKDIYRYVLTLYKNEAEAEEITQETFFQAMKSMPSFRGDCKMTVWLCQIAKHIYFARLRKKKHLSEQAWEKTLDGYETADSSLEQRLADESDALRTHQHLHRLKVPYIYM